MFIFISTQVPLRHLLIEQFLNPMDMMDYVKRKSKGLAVRLYGNGILKGSYNYKKAIILSRSRTGSSLLIHLLNSHPNLYFYGEVIRDLNDRDPHQILGNIFSPKPPFIYASGFKIFYYHPEDNSGDTVWEWLQSQKDLYVIHLKRDNILRTLVSRKIAESSGIWKQNSDEMPAQSKKIWISKEECEKFFEQTRTWEESYADFFRNHPGLEITYESLTGNDSEKELNRVQSFLGVKPVRLKTSLVKQNPEQLEDLIENFHELEESFHHSKWAHFFDE